MKVGITHPVELFPGPDGKVHATPATAGWRHRSAICELHNPVLGWDDLPEGTEIGRVKVHTKCLPAARRAFQEQKALERAKKQ